MSVQRRKFMAEFKAEAIALVRRTGHSANQIAKELGVSQTALSRWLRQSTVPSPTRVDFRPPRTALAPTRSGTVTDGARHAAGTNKRTS